MWLHQYFKGPSNLTTMPKRCHQQRGQSFLKIKYTDPALNLIN